MEKIDCANILLREVFTVCRAKSNVPLKDWKELQDKIGAFLKEEMPDVEAYKHQKIVVQYRNEKAHNDLIRQLEVANTEIKRLEEYVGVYQRREMEMRRVLNGNLYNQYKNRDQ